ncbi:PEP-CTERM sorting domain-containing protein [Roseateles cavernae]|uniref:PEP-CTERM sorting domain-containing protein n=1 Tax=Roseateles cavernae TaxID=3153578 RepID=UPI0032E4B57A
MKTTLIATALLALAAQAQAAQYTGAQGTAVVGTDYVTASELFFDLDFASRGSVTLSFAVEAQDLASPLLSFNSVVRNLSGLGFEGVSVKLDGASFALPQGTVATDGFQPVQSWGSNSGALWAKFGGPGVTTDFYLGKPLAEMVGTDWTLDLSGRQVGDVFSITVAVPEPESYALMLVGLAAVGWVARRRKS